MGYAKSLRGFRKLIESVRLEKLEEAVKFLVDGQEEKSRESLIPRNTLTRKKSESSQE